MSHPPQNNRNRLQKKIRRWHRWVGYSSLVLVIILSLTGLLLNRTAKLGLTQITVQNKIITALYGLAPDRPAVYFPNGDHWIGWLEGRLYQDTTLLAQNSSLPRGVATWGDQFAVATQDNLLLFLADGTLVETLDQTSLPGPIQSMGVSHLTPQSPPQLTLEIKGIYYVSHDDFLTWTTLPDTALYRSSVSRHAPEHLSRHLLEDFQGQGLSLYKIILDLHSGHIFGTYGPYLMDLAAISLIFLGITGLMKRTQNGKNKRNKK